MEKEFIPYEQALALKELGFDEDCFKCKIIGAEHLDYTPSDYDDFPEQKEKEVLIPTFSQAFRFFREKYRLHSSFTIGHDEDKIWYDWLIIPIELGYEYNCLADSEEGRDYEQSELDCLKKLIEIAKYK